jgi:uncharacterized protein (TIGR02001 family)
MRWLGPLAALAAAHTPGILFARSGAEAADGIEPERSASAASLDGSLAFVSDYRFRGISNSDLSPAIQASVQLDTASGIFLGLWGSSIADLDGANAEIDLTAGWSGTLGTFDTSVGVIAYLFPAGDGTEVVELFGTAGFALGPATATLGLNWAPAQANLDRASRYAHATVSAALPGKPLTLRASLGHERNGLPLRRSADPANKWDWQLGADVTLPALTIGVAYVGTDLPSRDRMGNRANRLGGDGVVLRLSAYF